ncbi:MAG: hypothetical protein ACKOEO_01615, partial [Planctomycetaceae bacterium]
MPLSRWLKHCSELLQNSKSLSNRRKLRRHLQQRIAASITRVCPNSEMLEERTLPASFSWVGDVNHAWSANLAGDTNWAGDAMPGSGATLVFEGSGTGTLDNNLPANNSFSMTFETGGYTITGNSIRLDNAGTDVIQVAGENLLQTPLQLDASSVDVQAGVLDLQGAVSGTAGLTKLGSGTLILTGP